MYAQRNGDIKSYSMITAEAQKSQIKYKDRKSMLRKFKISSRLIVAFSLLTLILAITSIISIYQINTISKRANTVVDLRIPTSQASASVLNGVNHALAALRGWMLLGKDKFKSENNIR